jgi:hypothetical protein
MAVLGYVVSEELWLLLDVFEMEVMNSCGYSWNISGLEN